MLPNKSEPLTPINGLIFMSFQSHSPQIQGLSGTKGELDCMGLRSQLEPGEHTLGTLQGQTLPMPGAAEPGALPLTPVVPPSHP